MLRRLAYLSPIFLRAALPACSLPKLGAQMSSSAGLSEGCVGAPAAAGSRLPLQGAESLMAKKGSFGSTAQPVQANLQYGISNSLANRICCFNRHYAEPSGSFTGTSFFAEANRSGETTFYDSVTGRPLFIAPRGRTFAEFEAESRAHGWPSFRDAEVVWDDVRCLPDGECVSTAGTHLGHNLPDSKGNRYCINLCSVAGRPL